MIRSAIVTALVAGAIVAPAAGASAADSRDRNFYADVVAQCRHKPTPKAAVRCDRRVERRVARAERKKVRVLQREARYVEKFGPRFAKCARRKMVQNRRYCVDTVRDRVKGEDPTAYALWDGDRWACNRTIVVDYSQAPAWHRPIIESAVAKLRAASGLNLVTRAGDGDITVILDPEFVHKSDALALAVSQDLDEDDFYDKGSVWIGQYMLDRDPSSPTESIYMHEFSHTLGLAHVENNQQMMHYSVIDSPILRGGDRAGLKKVGC